MAKHEKIGTASVVLALLLAFSGFAGGITDSPVAQARPGGGGGGGGGAPKGYFQVYSLIKDASGTWVEQHRWALNTAVAGAGWVYGNRQHYQCVYWFLDQGGKHVAKVTYQRVTGAPYLKITDKFGDQHPFHPGEKCGTTEEYVQNLKPAGLPSTTVSFNQAGVSLNSLLFPSVSPLNPNTWFELDEASPEKVLIEQYAVDTTVALVTITRLDPSLELVVSQA